MTSHGLDRDEAGHGYQHHELPPPVRIDANLILDVYKGELLSISVDQVDDTFLLMVNQNDVIRLDFGQSANDVDLTAYLHTGAYNLIGLTGINNGGGNNPYSYHYRLELRFSDKARKPRTISEMYASGSSDGGYFGGQNIIVNFHGDVVRPGE